MESEESRIDGLKSEPDSLEMTCICFVFGFFGS